MQRHSPALFGLGRLGSPLGSASCVLLPAAVDFMMKFELGISKPADSRPFTSALAVGGSYVVGGLVPLIPVRTQG